MRDYCSSITCLKNSQTIVGLEQPKRYRKNYNNELKNIKSNDYKAFGTPSSKMPNLRLKSKRISTNRDLFRSQIILI